MPKLSRWLPFLHWPRPDARLLRGEGFSAVTVAVVMIPQSVAYAGLAGMRALRRQLRGRRFDALLQMQVAARANLLSAFLRQHGLDRRPRRRGAP